MGCKHFITLIIFSISVAKATALEYTYKYNERCHKAYMYYMALQFTDGNNTIKAELKANPGNLMAVYIADYADCMLLLFNGDKNDYDKLHYHLEQRQNFLDNGDASSPWFRLCKAGIYMHWAFIYIRMGENFKAATIFRKSYLLLKENKKRFPTFAYNDIFFGLEEAVVGTVPDDYKWLASIFGLKGDVKKGVAKISSFLNTHTAQDPLYYDALIFNTYLRFYLMSQQEQIWQMVNTDKFPSDNNLLFSFVKANLALNYRKADAALQVLRNMQQLSGYNSIPAFDFEMGSALIFKADPDAVTYLKRFVANYKGKLFIKDALHKIANAYYLNGSIDKATAYRKSILENGSTNVDADRRAQRFAGQTNWPLPILLQASLLVDGGYYKKALLLLNTKKETDFNNVTDKAEFNLRLGRAYDEAGEDETALLYYNRAIALGKDAKEYFAARAALQSGFLFERKGNVKMALENYRQCLEMPVQDYKNAIKQQAKAGINRLSMK